MITIFLWGMLAAVFIGACSTPFDVLRAKTEDLSTELYYRASWEDIWFNLIPRGDYPNGAGYQRSAFTMQRSEPATEEESWQNIAKIGTTDGSASPPLNTLGACNITYNQTYVGATENKYSPQVFGLLGPDLCQDDLPMYWQSSKWWEQYFKALDKRNRKSIVNRLGNIYRQYSHKAACGPNFAFVAGNLTNPIPQAVDMSSFTGANVPTSELTQEFLDATAQELIEEGAQEGNSSGWITLGPDGPQFPLNIGMAMSRRIFLNNPELRQDVNMSFQGAQNVNPVLKRVGASRVLINFRHVINVFPARWALVTTGQVINYSNTAANNGGGGTIVTVTTTIVGAVATHVLNDTAVTTWTSVAANGQAYVRIPSFVMGTGGQVATFGQGATVNGAWRDPAVAKYESAEVLNPEVFTEEILMPVNSLPGAKLTPQNYFGEWKFVTGNDAFLGIAGCAGIQDPMHKRGRHFAEYRMAARPGIPVFGRMMLFVRCANSYDSVTCS